MSTLSDLSLLSTHFTSPTVISSLNTLRVAEWDKSWLGCLDRILVSLLGFSAMFLFRRLQHYWWFPLLPSCLLLFSHLMIITLNLFRLKSQTRFKLAIIFKLFTVILWLTLFLLYPPQSRSFHRRCSMDVTRSGCHFCLTGILYIMFDVSSIITLWIHQTMDESPYLGNYSLSGNAVYSCLSFFSVDFISEFVNVHSSHFFFFFHNDDDDHHALALNDNICNIHSHLHTMNEDDQLLDEEAGDGGGEGGSLSALTMICVSSMSVSGRMIESIKYRIMPSWFIRSESLVYYLLSTMVALFTAIVSLIHSNSQREMNFLICVIIMSGMSSLILFLTLLGWLNNHIQLAIFMKALMFGVKSLMAFYCRRSHKIRWEWGVFWMWTLLTSVSALILSVITFTISVKSKSRLKSNTWFSVICIGVHWCITQAGVLLILITAIFRPIQEYWKTIPGMVISQLIWIVPSKLLNYSWRLMWIAKDKCNDARKVQPTLRDFNVVLQMLLTSLLSSLIASVASCLVEFGWQNTHTSVPSITLPMLSLFNLLLMKNSLNVPFFQ